MCRYVKLLSCKLGLSIVMQVISTCFILIQIKEPEIAKYLESEQLNKENGLTGLLMLPQGQGNRNQSVIR